MSSTVATDSPQTSRQTLIALALIVITGALLRFYQLGAHDLWLDEIFTGIFVTAQNTWAEVFERILTEPNPLNPLIYVVTHFILIVFGENSVTLRLFAAITGTLGVLAIYFVGRAYFNRKVGLIAALLLAIAPMHVFHSREARYYAPVVLFSLLSYYFLHRGLQSGQRKWWIGFTLASILNIYTHLTAFFVLIVEVLYASILSLEGYISSRERSAASSHLQYIVKPLSFSTLAIAFSYLPMVPVMLGWINGPQAIGNEGATDGFELTGNFFLQLYANFGAGLGIPLSLFLSACLIGLIVSWRTDQRPALLFLLIATIPFVLILLARPKHFFVQKYVISILPLYLIFIARGIEYLAERISSTLKEWTQWRFLSLASLIGLTSLFVAISLQRINEPYETQIDQWQNMSTLLEANVSPDHAVAVLPTFLITAQGDEVIGYLDPLPPGMDITVAYQTSELSALRDQHKRVWVIQEDQLSTLEQTEHLLVWLASTPTVTFTIDELRKVHYLGKDASFDLLFEEVASFNVTEASIYASIGDTYAEQERWEEGVAAYQEAFELAPNKGIWHMRLAMLYEQMGDLTSAEDEYLLAIELDPEIPGLYAALADYYRVVGRDQEAIDQYQQALSLWRKQIVGRDTTPYSQLWQQHVNELQIGLLP